MKVLFDNNVPRKLRRFLPGHEVVTAREMGWQELENGHLLAAGEAAGFEVMMTGDKNLSYQQNLTGRQIALIVLPTIDWNVLKLHPAPIAAALDRVTRGSFERLDMSLPPGSKGRSGPQR